ncbi:hypothetical protein ANANG_G00109260 [Anguilla anguilla]|uniref:Uncharacterized protein n=1 Tax=Anguilla anguilla TaxID=7936 RepID=A0A9D3MI35_ANGAN|nr:hypothetical protein ANANG_G00109260 [Anguilla anguilla]
MRLFRERTPLRVPGRGPREDSGLPSRAADPTAPQRTGTEGWTPRRRRLAQLRRELQESQQELQRGRGRTQQLQGDLAAAESQAQELRAQLSEVRGRLVQVEGENEALRAGKLERSAEVSLPLCGVLGRRERGARDGQAERRCVELERELREVQVQLTHCQERAQSAEERAEEQLKQLQTEVSSLKAQHSSANQQLQERSVEVQEARRALEEARRALEEARASEREQSRDYAALRLQLSRAREELVSATRRQDDVVQEQGEERRRVEELCEQLQGEVGRLQEQLDSERAAIRTQRCQGEEELERLRKDQQQMKDEVIAAEHKASRLQREAELAGRARQEEAAEREAELGDWRSRCRQASEALGERDAELGEAQRARDSAHRSLRLQEERAQRLGAEKQRLEEALGEGGQAVGDDAHAIRLQLRSSQDALQQVTAELRACRREVEERDSLIGQKEEQVEVIQADLEQLQQQYTTCYTQLVQEEQAVSRLKEELRDSGEQTDLLASQVAELNTETQRLQQELDLLTEKHTAAQQEVASRDEAVLKLTADLRSAQEHLRTAQEELTGQVQETQAQEEEVRALQKEVQRLQEALILKQSAVEEEQQRSAQLQQERDTLQAQCEGQQGALCGLREELERCQEEARAQGERREEEAQGLREQLQEVQARAEQHRSSTDGLRADLEHAQNRRREAEEEGLQRDGRLRAQEAELTKLRAALQEAESVAADAEARLEPLSQSVDLSRQKYQACLAKVSEREEQAARLRAEVAALHGDLRAHCAQLESGDDALSALSLQLRSTQQELHESRSHGQECEQVIGTLRENCADLRRQVEEQEEMVVKVQADFSAYRATHMHADSDYNSQLSRIQELQQALSRAMEQCAQGSQALSESQATQQQLRDEVCRVSEQRDSSKTEALRLQEVLSELKGELLGEVQRRQAEVELVEQQAARLEEDLRVALRQCAQKEQAVQKRDALLRKSEADLVEARSGHPAHRQGRAHRARRESQQREAVLRPQGGASAAEGGAGGRRPPGRPDGCREEAGERDGAGAQRRAGALL